MRGIAMTGASKSESARLMGLPDTTWDRHYAAIWRETRRALRIKLTSTAVERAVHGWTDANGKQYPPSDTLLIWLEKSRFGLTDRVQVTHEAGDSLTSLLGAIGKAGGPVAEGADLPAPADLAGLIGRIGSDDEVGEVIDGEYEDEAPR